MGQQPRIFISYRRVDEPNFVGRMYDHFVSRYGEENVFIDQKIPDFTRFKKHIIKKVDESDVLVAVIGPKWLELLKRKSERGERDLLVMEIERALDKGIMIAPICIKDAPVPEKDDLPSGIRTRIQEMLDCHIPRVRGWTDFRDHFRDDMKKRIGFIEQELEERDERDYKFDRTTDLDKFLDQPLEELENDIFELLEVNNVLRIEKYLREFPSYFLNKASEIEMEESQDDILKILIDKIIVFGVVFIQHNRHIQPELYQEFLRTLRLVFEGAHEWFRTPHSKYADETLRIWADLLPKLYLLGAILVQKDKYEWMSDFVKHPISWEHGDYYKGVFWMQYMRMQYMQNMQIDGRTFLTRIINIIKEDSCFCQQFLDEEKIKNYICQFDFIQCVYTQISMGIGDDFNNLRPNPLPFFAQYYRERIVPIIQRIIEDTQFRDMLFGEQLDDKKLAEIILRLINRARDIFGYWEGSLSREILLFLKNNLPSDAFTNRRYF